MGLAVLLWTQLALARTLAPRDVPDPRPAHAVLDMAGLLDAGAIATLDAYAESVARDGDSELLVITLPRIPGGADAARGYATAVFNHLGIGSAHAHRGVLLFVAIEDRAAELILGEGIDGPAETAIADAIMQQVMVPAFRRSDPQAALLNGARDVAHRLLGLPQPEAPLPGTSGWQPPRVPQPITPKAADDGDDTGMMVGAAAGGGGVLLAGVVGIRRWLRNRPRNCDRCGTVMTRLGEQADDAHLDAGQRREEQLKSVDYDVWACPACEHAQTLRYGAFFTTYSRCAQCRYVTRSSTSTTLVAATYSHGGKVRVDTHCQHCGHRTSATRNTPRKTRSSSSGGGSGGGRSRGGGSSGRW